MANADNQELIKKVKESVNGYFSTPEIQYNLNMRFTVPRARCWVIHLSRFILHRRDCWALAMGQAPFDVKKEIWRHEQDELISDPRAGGLDHYTLRLQGAEELWGVTRDEIESAELHPFVTAAFEAWLHLAKRSWLESFSSVSVAEMINSDAIVSGGGDIRPGTDRSSCPNWGFGRRSSRATTFMWKRTKTMRLYLIG